MYICNVHVLFQRAKLVFFVGIIRNSSDIFYICREKSFEKSRNIYDNKQIIHIKLQEYKAG
jgi:hypothetical protein